MNNYEDNARINPRGVEINLGYIFRVALKKWWAILLAMIIAASAFVVGEEVLVDDTYTSSFSFITNNKSIYNEEYLSNSDVSASITMANTFKYILSGRTLMTKVKADLDKIKADLEKDPKVPQTRIRIYDLTLEQIERCITVQNVTDTNIIEMSVKTEHKELSMAIANSIVKNYKPIADEKYPDTSLKVCDAPSNPNRPDVGTSTFLIAAIGAIIGAVIVVIWLLIVDVSEDTVKSIADISERIDINIMGAVSQVDKGKEKDGEPKKRLLITEKGASFGFVETYKAIRTKLEVMATRKGYKTFVVTSTRENEGKTTVATNIAISLAQNGKSVLLIDADLRKPSVSKMFGLKEDETKTSFVDVISGKNSVDSCVKYIDQHKLFVLAGQKSLREPTELLSTVSMEMIIESAKKEFDFVIIDTPPAGLVADAAIISKYADAAVFVIRENAAHIAEIGVAIKDVGNSGIDIIGCVYNCVNIPKHHGYYGRKRRYGYGGYYGYGYGYGYGYYGYGHSHSDKDK